MKIFQKVRGSQSNVPEIEVNVDTVYVRSNIERIETEEFVGWQYDEIQYTKNEFMDLVASKTVASEEYVVDVDFRLTILEMGL